ncbi:hypothetical protein DICVIV_11185 [Dictyocaulus viviparus]|uniref:Uncharacterized protein n=1 Tax=Dictyocaulus viviparus TaxID=29172 RepID=A0A0D8XKG6_DICVI|nr:hypothetical protein DICVIV_11185 [Dictyocaulus viviparus]
MSYDLNYIAVNRLMIVVIDGTMSYDGIRGDYEERIMEKYTNKQLTEKQYGKPKCVTLKKTELNDCPHMLLSLLIWIEKVYTTITIVKVKQRYKYLRRRYCSAQVNDISYDVQIFSSVFCLKIESIEEKACIISLFKMISYGYEKKDAICISEKKSDEQEITLELSSSALVLRSIGQRFNPISDWQSIDYVLIEIHFVFVEVIRCKTTALGKIKSNVFTCDTDNVNESEVELIRNSWIFLDYQTSNCGNIHLFHYGVDFRFIKENMHIDD